MRRVMIFGVLCLVGCFGGFDSGLGLSNRHGATLTVNVNDIGTVDVSAWLDAGTTRGGDRRDVRSAMRVRGTDVPFPAHNQPPMQVTTRVDLAGVRGIEPLIIVPPSVSGLTPDPAQLSFSTLRPRDGDTVTALGSGDVRLRTQVAAGAGPALDRRWELTIVGATTVSVQGEGLPPEHFTIPAALLPAQRPSAARGWSVMLAFTERQGRYAQNFPLTTEYFVNGVISQRLTVEVRPSAP